MSAALALAAALGVGMGVVACGSSSTPTLTKAEYLAKANAICAEGNKKQESAGQALGANPSKAQITAFVTGTAVPSIQSQIVRIRALGAPSGEQATVTHILAVGEEDLNKVKSNPLLLASGPAAFAGFVAIARPYGLTACAAGSASSESSSSTSSSSSASSSSPASSSGPAPSAGATSGSASAVSVEADRAGGLKFDTSTLSAPAGKVTIAFTNDSPLPHNVTVASASGAVLGATPTFQGGSRTLSLALKPGTYKFYCSVPGHKEAGMEGTLTVR